MELDDLRRQWQQVDQSPQPLADVTALLSHRSTNLVEKMRRNALLEASITVLLVVAIPFVPMQPSSSAPPALLTAFRILLMLLMLAMLYYYYRKLKLLQRIVQPEVQVRAHLAALCTGLRQMLRFYYWLSLSTVPAVLLLIICFEFGRELAQRATHHWEKLLLFAGALLLMGALLQVLMIWTTRWYLQRLYGQHLDRIEGQVRELDESAAPATT